MTRNQHDRPRARVAEQPDVQQLTLRIGLLLAAVVSLVAGLVRAIG